jgi:hypothetical protein
MKKILDTVGNSVVIEVLSEFKFVAGKTMLELQNKPKVLLTEVFDHKMFLDMKCHATETRDFPTSKWIKSVKNVRLVSSPSSDVCCFLTSVIMASPYFTHYRSTTMQLT